MVYRARSGESEDLSQYSGRDIVLVHSSDIHVDDGYTARMHGGDGARGLASVLGTAAALAADAVLLAGDVFEHNRLPDPLLERAAGLLGGCGMAVVALPGNHDPLTADSVWRRCGMAEAETVSVLGLTHAEAVRLAGLDLEIWGTPHRDYGDMAPLAAARPRTTRWQVAMAHGHYRGDEDANAAHRPSWLISDEEIAATGADYLALGHWNRPVRVGNGAVPAWYSGSPDLARTVNHIRLAADGTVNVDRAEIVWE